MTNDRWSSLVARVFFAGAFVLLAAAVMEAVAKFSGYTILRGAWTPSRLLEYSAVLLVFVLALLLRQIRDRLQKP